MTTLDQLEALADAAKRKDAFTGKWMVNGIDQHTLLQLIALVRQQHDALDLACSWVPEDVRLWLLPVDEALAEFDKFNGGE